MNGFRYDEATLTQAADYLWGGTVDLDYIADSLPEAVDAGFSSEVVGAALVRVAKGCIVLAQVGDEISQKLNAAKGSYADIENTNEGRIRYEGQLAEGDVKTIDQRNREARQKETSNPFENAPTESDPPPEPKPAAPGRTPEPPPAN